MSLRLKLLNAGLRIIVKTPLRRAEDMVKLRRAFAFVTKWGLRPPPFTLQLTASLTSETGAVRVHWMQCHALRSDAIILYFHGGGYIAGSSRTHSALTATLAQLTGLRVCVPDYRLAPEHKFPAAVTDAIICYTALIARGYPARQIILAGDSAGGGLMFALLHHILQAGLPIPAGAFAFSPWTDLAFTGASLTQNKHVDPIFPPARIAILGDMYLAAAAAQNPLASPLYGDFAGAPPVMIQVGSSEILLDDSRRLANVLDRAGVDVDLEIWKNTPHVWQVFHGTLPEADSALKKVAEFVERTLR